MKFKIGDKVKLNKNIKDFRYGRAGVSYEEIGTIIRINKYRNTVDFPSHASWDGTEEELVLAKYTYEDLKKSPIGTKITFENGLVLVKTREGRFENYIEHTYIEYLKNLGDNCHGKIIKIEEPTYQTVYEAKEEILDEAEKRYLRGVIRPYKTVKCINKSTYDGGNKAAVTITVIDIDGDNWEIQLPPFETRNMYKNMKNDKDYTLKELGL